MDDHGLHDGSRHTVGTILNELGVDIVTSMEILQHSQGHDMRELDGHPLLQAAMESAERYRLTSGEAGEALRANVERISAAASEAFSMADVLMRNKEGRERRRERFTSAAREALSKTPAPDLRSDRE